MKLTLEKDNVRETAENGNTIECKFCKSPINLAKTKSLPKKLIMEKHGLCWTGLEKVYLIIHKIQCQNCGKKYSHKVFKSQYLYK